MWDGWLKSHDPGSEYWQNLQQRSKHFTPALSFLTGRRVRRRTPRRRRCRKEGRGGSQEGRKKDTEKRSTTFPSPERQGHIDWERRWVMRSPNLRATSPAGKTNTRYRPPRKWLSAGAVWSSDELKWGHGRRWLCTSLCAELNLFKKMVSAVSEWLELSSNRLSNCQIFPFETDWTTSKWREFWVWAWNVFFCTSYLK